MERLLLANKYIANLYPPRAALPPSSYAGILMMSLMLACRKHSEAAALYEQSYAQQPRLNYTYKNLPEIKPEGWEWRL